MQSTTHSNFTLLPAKTFSLTKFTTGTLRDCTRVGHSTATQEEQAPATESATQCWESGRGSIEASLPTTLQSQFKRSTCLHHTECKRGFCQVLEACFQVLRKWNPIHLRLPCNSLSKILSLTVLLPVTLWNMATNGNTDHRNYAVCHNPNNSY